MAKFRLKKVVTVTSFWETEAETPYEAVTTVERGAGKQVGWDSIEKNIVVTNEEKEDVPSDRALIEKLGEDHEPENQR